MKKTVCLLFLLLTACTSTVPIPTATAVILPTTSPTVESTATPDAIAPILSDLQKMGIDASHNNGVWIFSFGGVEIPNAKLNEDGFTVTTDVGEINVPLSEMNARVENANGSLVVKDEAGGVMAVFDAATEKWLNPDQMTNEQKFDLAPESIDGFTKSNWSTVIDGILIYRDAQGIAQLAYTPLTGEKSNLQEVGTIELHLTDGTKWEMSAVTANIPKDASEETIAKMERELVEKAYKFMVENGVAWGDLGRYTIDDVSQADKDLIYRRMLIPGYKPIGELPVPFDKKVKDADSFLVGVCGILIEGTDGTVVTIISDEGNRKVMFIGISADKFWNISKDNRLYIPPKPSQ
jgi:hypothetical protein